MKKNHGQRLITKKEPGKWVETLNTNQFKLIESFFTSMPKLSYY